MHTVTLDEMTELLELSKTYAFDSSASYVIHSFSVQKEFSKRFLGMTI